MGMTRLWQAALVLIGGIAASALAVMPPEMADLVKVKSRHLDEVHLLPGTDFKAYKKVMIDPAQVSFAKNWMRDMNDQRGSMGGGKRITPEDVKQITDEARKGFGDIFTAAFKQAGIEVVTANGPDVLRLTPAVINIYVNAPNVGSTATRTYVMSAGQAVFALAVRDSVTGTLLGMALDRRETRSSMAGPVMTNGVVNRAEFDVLFKQWANIAVKGFKGLQESPPVAEKKK